MSAEGDVKYQYFAGICVNIISVSFGAFCGWLSPSLLELQSVERPPLETGPLTNQDAGLIGSMLCIGGIVGTVFFAWLVDKIGRKNSLLVVAVPSLLGWLIIPFARSPLHLCISRFFGGFSGGGSFAVIPIYTTELAQNSVRGTLGTFLVLSCNVGILFAFSLGCLFSYSTVAWTLSMLTVFFMLTFVFLPDTPQHLMKKNKARKAEKALRYFHNIRRMSKALPEHLKYELQRLQSNESCKNDEDSAVTWADFNNYTARRALMISMVLVLLNQLSGCFAMMNYTANIFQEAGSHMSPNVAALVVAAIQLVGSYMSTLLVERAGRKFLLILSAVLCGLGHVCLGTYSLLNTLGYDVKSYAWITVASLSFTIFIACWGVLPLPYLVLSEILPPKIRNIGTMVCMLGMWSFGFVLIKYLPVISQVLGMHGMVYTFAGFCFAGALFVFIFLPETKGKSIEEILASL